MILESRVERLRVQRRLAVCANGMMVASTTMVALLAASRTGILVPLFLLLLSFGILLFTMLLCQRSEIMEGAFQHWLVNLAYDLKARNLHTTVMEAESRLRWHLEDAEDAKKNLQKVLTQFLRGTRSKDAADILASSFDRFKQFNPWWRPD